MLCGALSLEHMFQHNNTPPFITLMRTLTNFVSSNSIFITTSIGMRVREEGPYNHGDDDWSLRQVIIECNHRMKRAFFHPPIYDQIVQAV